MATVKIDEDVVKAFAACNSVTVRKRAAFLSQLDTRARDYLLQAPILALATIPYNLDDVTHIWRRVCREGETLGHMMDSFKVNRALRWVSLEALNLEYVEMPERLMGCNTSALAQALRARSVDQQRWLFAYLTAMAARGVEAAKLCWFAERAPLEWNLDAGHAVDFMRSVRGRRWNEGWKWRDWMAQFNGWEDDFRKQKAIEEAAYNEPLTPVVDAPKEATVDGYTFKLLNTENELRAEGAEMNHCVGGYGVHVKSGMSLIYAVRRNGQKTGTLQITPSMVRRRDGGPRKPEDVRMDVYVWSVVQFKAARNAEPERDAQKAAAEFVNQINTPKDTHTTSSAPDLLRVLQNYWTL